MKSAIAESMIKILTEFVVGGIDMLRLFEKFSMMPI